jgi:hypothetical protein
MLTYIFHLLIYWSLFTKIYKYPNHRLLEVVVTYTTLQQISSYCTSERNKLTAAAAVAFRPLCKIHFKNIYF